jgi:hypothetical protein
MSRVIAVAAVTAGLAAGLPGAGGAQERDSLCAAKLVEDGISAEDAELAPCSQLADALVTNIVTPRTLAAMRERVPARDFQSRATGNAGTSGAPSQSEAVPSVQPLALAGGSLAAVGSEGGTNAIAGFTINPAILFGPQDPTQAAALSRLLDLTVLAPVNDLDRDEDGTIDYFGIRARINVTGPGAGRHLAKAVEAFADQTQMSTEISASLDSLLTTTETFEECVAALREETVDPGKMERGCGRSIDLTTDEAILARLREALSLARDSADARYFGLDLRLDQGDPTLGATPGAAGTSLFAGLAYGRKIVATQANRPSFGLKARLGVQHVSLDDQALDESDRTNTAIDGALAFDFTYPYQFQPLKLAAGLEFRAGDPPVADAEKEFRTNFLQARLSLDVPITAANSISIAFAGPLTGDERPTLSINANWQLLLSGLAGPLARGRGD